MILIRGISRVYKVCKEELQIGNGRISAKMSEVVVSSNIFKKTWSSSLLGECTKCCYAAFSSCDVEV